MQATLALEASRPVVEAGRVAAPFLVGRERELELLASAVSSPPVVVSVEGEAGIGKTRLVSELAASPQLAGRRWLWGACRRVQEPFPLGPVIEALRGAAEDLGGMPLSPLAGALRPLLPELSELLPEEPAALGDRAAERHRVFRAVVEVLAGLGPAALVLEDLHWADQQTLEFIAYLASDPPSEIALVLTFRPEEVESSVRASIAKLPRTVRRVEARLEPLDAEQTGVLGAAILGADHMSEEFAEHLCARASGVPFAIEELLALLQARGSLVRGAAGWARRALAELDVPSGIRDPVLERVSRLSEPARSVVEAAAVLEVPVPVSALVVAAGVREPWTLRAVDEALTSGLLAEHPEGVAFRHVLAAQAVYAAIPGGRRTELHGRVASVFEDLDPLRIGQRAYHLKRAGRVSEWVRAAQDAADAAVALGHDVEAVRLLEELLREARLDPDHRLRVAVKLGRTCAESGLPRPDLVDLVAGQLGQDMSRAVGGELRFWLSLMMLTAGSDRRRMRSLSMQAVEDLEDAVLRARAMHTLGIALQPDVAASEHRLWLTRALEVVATLDDPVSEVRLLGSIAMSLGYLGDPRWRGLADEIVARTDGAPRTRVEADAYLRVAMVASYIGDHERAASLLAAVAGRPDTHDHPGTGREFACMTALLDFCRGDWAGLPERVEALREPQDLLARLDLGAVAGSLALATGRTDEARRDLADAAHELEASGDRSLLAFVVAAVARDAVTTGSVEDALEMADGFIDSLEVKQLWPPLTRALPAVTALLLACGHESRARALVARFADEAADADAPLASAALAHARGFLDGSQGRHARAARHFLTAADEYERRSCPYEAAQAREQAAAALLSTDPTAAERELRAALGAYQALGASWDHARCVRLARTHGVRIAATHRRGRKGYGDALSPREQQVARLAADGLSNKAIAAELYLSPHTVDKHLGRAMRKLGVHSRALLDMRLAELPPADER